MIGLPLTVSGLTRRYGDETTGTLVLDGLCLTAQPGETVAVVGPSGAGKSTLLHILGSLDRPTSGTVFLGEMEVTKLSGKALAEFRATAVGFVFQDHHLLPQLTALENVLLPTLAAGSRPDAGTAGKDLLDRMGVSHRSHAYPAQMSGGERQRVAIARAMINGAHLLLCDEPTGNLDRATGRAIAALFRDLASQRQVTVIMATHNLEMAASFGTAHELRDGRLHSAHLLDTPQ